MNNIEEDEYYFFNNIVFDESLNELKKRDGHKSNTDTEAKVKVCIHNWKKYEGFTEVYYYCENCDQKSNHDYESSKKWYVK